MGQENELLVKKLRVGLKDKDNVIEVTIGRKDSMLSQKRILSSLHHLTTNSIFHFGSF